MTISISSLKNPELIANEVYTLSLGTDLAQTFALRNGVMWRATASSTARGYTSSISGALLSNGRAVGGQYNGSSEYIYGITIVDNLLIANYVPTSGRTPHPNTIPRKLKAFVISSSNTLASVGTFDETLSVPGNIITSNNTHIYMSGWEGYLIMYAFKYTYNRTTVTLSIERDAAEDFVPGANFGDMTIANNELIGMVGARNSQKIRTFDLSTKKLTKRMASLPSGQLYVPIASDDSKIYVGIWRYNNRQASTKRVITFRNEKTSSSNVQLVALTDEDNHDMFPKKVWVTKLIPPSLIASETYRITGFSDQVSSLLEKNGVLWFSYNSGVNSFIRGWILSSNRATPAGLTLSNATITGMSESGNILIVGYADSSDKYRRPGENFDRDRFKLKAFIINPSNTFTEITGFNPTINSITAGKPVSNEKKLWLLYSYIDNVLLNIAYNITKTSTTISIERDPANDFIDHEGTRSGPGRGNTSK